MWWLWQVTPKWTLDQSAKDLLTHHASLTTATAENHRNGVSITEELERDGEWDRATNFDT